MRRWRFLLLLIAGNLQFRRNDDYRRRFIRRCRIERRRFHRRRNLTLHDQKMAEIRTILLVDFPGFDFRRFSLSSIEVTLRRYALRSGGVRIEGNRSFRLNRRFEESVETTGGWIEESAISFRR